MSESAAMTASARGVPWTRLWMGSLLIALTAGVLFFDPAPAYPLLITYIHLLGLAATLEMHGLLGPGRAPPRWLCVVCVQGVLAANWPPHLLPALAGQGGWLADPWRLILAGFSAVVLVSLLYEMVVYREPGLSVSRSAVLVWLTGYLGLLPAFLAQQRWLGPEAVTRGAACLALTIFVAKACDIGAFFTGRALGRHRMTPALSPNKTWEGLAGGLALSALVALGLQRWLGVPGCWGTAVGFGLTVGLAGVVGDLAESLIKRDVGQKDASRVVPGFGGVLDVIDSLLFAAPVAYLWLGGGW